MSGGEGLAEIQQLRAGGFNETDIASWQAEQTDSLRSGGFTQDEINTYWGNPKPDIDKPVATASENLKAFKQPASEGGKVKEVKDWREAFEAGFQVSVSGLTARRGLPDKMVAEDADVFARVAGALGTVAGDIPYMWAGATLAAPAAPASAAAGATIGALGGPVGGAVGGAIGGAAPIGAGAAALPTFMREGLIRYYKKGGRNAKEYAANMVGAFFNKETIGATTEQAVVGAATGGLGRGAKLAAGAKAAKMGLGATTTRAATLTAEKTAEIAGMTAATAAMAKEMPTAETFAESAVMVGAMSLVGGYGGKAKPYTAKGAQKAQEQAQGWLLDNYVATGEHPATAASRLARDPVARQNVWTYNVNQKLDEALPPQLRPMKKQIEKGADEVAMAEMTPEQRIIHKIVEPEGVSTVQEAIDRVRFDAFNDLHYAHATVRDVLDEVRKREGTQGVENVVGYGREALNKDGTLKREYDVAEQLHLSRGGIAMGERVIDQQLKPIFRKLVKKNDRYKSWIAFQSARRTIELNNRGVKTPFDVADAQAVYNAHKGDAEFQQISANLQAYNRRTLDRAEKAGLISAEDRQRIGDLNEEYLPFFRDMEDAEGAISPSGKGFKVKKPVKRMEGDDELDVLNPVKSLVSTTLAMEKAIANNEALHRLIGFNERLTQVAPDLGFLQKAPKQPNLIELAETDKNLADYLKRNGLNPADVNGIEIFRTVQKTLDDNQFLVLENGRPTVYETVGPQGRDLARSLSRMDVGAQNMFVKIMAGFAQSFKAGETSTPDFILRNAFFRDQFSAFLQNSHKSVPFLDWGVGAWTQLTNKAAVTEWIDSGAANSAMLAADHQIFKPDYFKLDRQGTIPKNLWNVVRTPVDLLQTVGMMADNASRLGQHMRADKGKQLPSEVVAARSRRHNMDFARMGASVRMLNSMGAFLGPQLNGIERFAQAFKDDPAGTLAKGTAAITIPSLTLWYFNKDEEWYKNTPQWVKDTHWLIRTAGTDEDPTIMKLPMPQMWGTFFGAAPVRMGESLLQHNPEAFKDFDKKMFEEFNPIPAAIPVAAKSPTEILANWDFFQSRALVSETTARNRLPEYQYTEYTSEVAKQIASMMPDSAPLITDGAWNRLRTPVAIDHLLRTWAGSGGLAIAQLAGDGVAMAAEGVHKAVDEDYEGTPVDPETKMTEWPFVKSFFVRNPNYDADAIQKVYEQSEMSAQVGGSYEFLLREGRYDEAALVMETEGYNKIKLYKFRKAFTNMRATMAAIQNDPSMKADEKRQLIDQTMQAMTIIAQGGEVLIDAIKSGQGDEPQVEELIQDEADAAGEEQNPVAEVEEDEAVMEEEDDDATP